MGALAANQLNTILQGDCISRMNAMEAGIANLVFADPPFNIGYEYDEYDDRLERSHYLDWSREWIAAVYRVLRNDGTFWLAIGDEYAAELKVASQEIGFHCRSWVIWYYTFGVNCSKKFSRSHAHLFYFVKDSANFTFREKELANRIPSARQLVYNDKRANSTGRLPDDTWIIRPADVVGEMRDDFDAGRLESPRDDRQTWTLRPQDLSECFQADEDTWYFPRVAGTFKERAGFHGCQMPEQLLGRIIRSCSDQGDVVLDPFSGSATTLVVAKKLGRQFLGFDLSEQYVEHGQNRLASARLGDRLDGSPEPLVSAPKTGRKQQAKSSQTKSAKTDALFTDERRFEREQLALTLRGIVEAFRATHQGFSADRLVADPDLNLAFTETCVRLGIVGGPRTWNVLLFRLRKSGHLHEVPTTQRVKTTWADCDPYLHASEVAMQSLLEEGADSIDEVLCDPALVARFDALTASLAPGFKPVEYRWAALKIRKQAKTARNRAILLKAPSRLGKPHPLDAVTGDELPAVYLLTHSDTKKRIYAGETLNLARRLTNHQAAATGWKAWSDDFTVQVYRTDIKPGDMLAWQSRFVQKYSPRLNYRELSL